MEQGFNGAKLLQLCHLFSQSNSPAGFNVRSVLVDLNAIYALGDEEMRATRATRLTDQSSVKGIIEAQTKRYIKREELDRSHQGRQEV